MKKKIRIYEIEKSLNSDYLKDIINKRRNVKRI